jgi:hypothetical protein
MRDYFIKDYHLTCPEFLQSFVVSEYGLRHLKQAELRPEHQWGHRIIALIDFVPVVGQLAMLIEWVVFQIFVSLYVGEARSTNKLLFTGTQIGCEGNVNVERVSRLVDDLNKRRAKGIIFNPQQITPIIKGGACSAMSLDFAEEFFKLKHVYAISGLPASDRFLSAIRALGQRFAQSNQEMRDRQAALNTIEILPNAQGIDKTRNKIQSLANLHHFTIDHASHEIQLDQAGYERTLQEEASNLPDGVYLLRSLKPFNNAKEEWEGHSMVYVKDHQERFFYDPNVGTTYSNNDNPVSDLSRALTYYRQMFDTREARFYRLVPSAPA